MHQDHGHDHDHGHGHDHGHDHGHGHGHDHGHGHLNEPGVLAPAARTASVAIDVGGGRGALILYPSERFRGREIEISRLDDEVRVHTGVHERTTQDRAQLTAIFGSIPAGDYVVWVDADLEGPSVTVPDGAVAQLNLD
jgi:hypothetical protein